MSGSCGNSFCTYLKASEINNKNRFLELLVSVEGYCSLGKQAFHRNFFFFKKREREREKLLNRLAPWRRVHAALPPRTRTEQLLPQASPKSLARPPSGHPICFSFCFFQSDWATCRRPTTDGESNSTTNDAAAASYSYSIQV